MLKQLLNNIKGDKWIWTIIFLLSLFSLLAVYSSTGTLAYKYRSGNTEYYLIKQILIIGGGLTLMYLMHLVNYKYFSRISQLLFWISILLLAFTLFFGTNINEAKRWITLPGVNLTFQTSDLAKFSLIMYLARILSKRQDQIKSFSEGFRPIILPVIVICGLIAPEDLSTSIVLFSTSVLIMFIGRVNVWYIAGLLSIAVLVGGLFVALLFSVDQSKLPGRTLTWKHRIESYWNENNEHVEPYQVTQAKIAIAKGGLFPNGPGNSTQKNFLPHPYSDFIYAIIIEEYGLLGGMCIVFLYLALLIRTKRIVQRSPKAFGALLAFGLSLSLVIQAMINMGVAVGLLPVTGLTLPLVSMGGSSTIFTSMALGIILSVSRMVEEEEVDEKTDQLETKVAIA